MGDAPASKPAIWKRYAQRIRGHSSDRCARGGQQAPPWAAPVTRRERKGKRAEPRKTRTRTKERKIAPWQYRRTRSQRESPEKRRRTGPSSPIPTLITERQSTCETTTCVTPNNGNSSPSLMDPVNAYPSQLGLQPAIKPKFQPTPSSPAAYLIPTSLGLST